MRLLSLEGARQSKDEPGSFRPRIVEAWWVSDELKCCLWTVLHAWKSPLGSWWQHSWVVAAYSSKCRQCLTLSNILPTLTEGQMDPESFKIHLKEPALGIEKIIKLCSLCTSRMTKVVFAWVLLLLQLLVTPGRMILFLAQFSLLSVWIFSWWAERSWFTLGTTQLWSQQQMPDAAGIQRSNESNPKCESAVGVMGVPPLLCLPLAFLAPSTLPSALVSAPHFSPVLFLQLHSLLSLFSAFCHSLTAHSCAMTTWWGSDVPHNDNEKPISIPLQFPGTPQYHF